MRSFLKGLQFVWSCNGQQRSVLLCLRTRIGTQDDPDSITNSQSKAAQSNPDEDLLTPLAATGRVHQVFFPLGARRPKPVTRLWRVLEGIDSVPGWARGRSTTLRIPAKPADAPGPCRWS